MNINLYDLNDGDRYLIVLKKKEGFIETFDLASNEIEAKFRI